MNEVDARGRRRPPSIGDCLVAGSLPQSRAQQGSSLENTEFQSIFFLEVEGPARDVLSGISALYARVTAPSFLSVITGVQTGLTCTNCSRPRTGISANDRRSIPTCASELSGDDFQRIIDSMCAADAGEARTVEYRLVNGKFAQFCNDRPVPQ